jgi:hypothetical protein
MPHCKAEGNPCRGIADCFCDCDRCIDADNAASTIDRHDEAQEEILFPSGDSE